MEASVALAEDVGRDLIMTYVWENVMDYFIEGNRQKARISYQLFEILEGMTDEEYASSFVCADSECSCHL